MMKFVVVSYAADRGEIYYDTLTATKREGAIAKVRAVRPYAKVMDVLTADDVTKLYRLVGEAKIEDVEAAWEGTLGGLVAAGGGKEEEVGNG